MINLIILISEKKKTKKNNQIDKTFINCSVFPSCQICSNPKVFFSNLFKFYSICIEFYRYIMNWIIYLLVKLWFIYVYMCVYQVDISQNNYYLYSYTYITYTGSIFFNPSSIISIQQFIYIFKEEWNHHYKL